MRNRNMAWGRGLRISLIAGIILALIIGGLWAFGAAGGSPSDTEPSPTATRSSASPDDIPDTDARVPADAWDIYAEEFAAFREECGESLDRSSLAAPAADDAADFVLKGDGKAVANLDAYKCRIATNPTVGDMLIRGLMNEKVPSGEAIGHLNPWMQEFVSTSSEDLLNWLEKDAEGNLYVSNEYQQNAFLLWTLLTRLKYEGEQQGRALVHYPLQTTEVTGLPRTHMIDAPYVGEFVILAYTQKGQECAFWVIGINTSDGRLALLENGCGKTPPPVETTPPPPVKTTPPPVTKTTPPPVTKTTPPPPVKTTPPPPVKTTPPPVKTTPPPVTKTTPPPVTKTTPPPPVKTTPPTPKVPSQDPAQNGNAGNGGGKNQDPGPGVYVPPSEMQRPAATQTVNKVPATPKATSAPKTTAPKVEVSTAPPSATRDTSDQENHGSVDPEPTRPEECNPTFMDC